MSDDRKSSGKSLDFFDKSRVRTTEATEVGSVFVKGRPFGEEVRVVGKTNKGRASTTDLAQVAQKTGSQGNSPAAAPDEEEPNNGWPAPSLLRHNGPSAPLVNPGAQRVEGIGQDSNANDLADPEEGQPVPTADPVAEDNLPHAVEYDTTATAENATKKHQPWLRALCVGAMVVPIVVVLVVLLPDWNTAETRSNTTSQNETLAPQPVQSLLPIQTQVAIQEQPGSPQGQAYNWTLHHPDLDTMPDTRIQLLFSLATFYYSLGGDQWKDNANWLSYDKHECTWFHSQEFSSRSQWLAVYNPFLLEYDQGNASCPDGNTMEHLWLDKNDLSGTIPWVELPLMSSLKSLSVWGHDNIVGTISTHIGRLTQLEGLSMMRTEQISGTIPTEIGLMTQLKTFLIGRTQLTGTLPTELAQLTNSMYWVIHQNKRFGGTIPPLGASLSNLRWISFDGCRGLTGAIPTSVGEISRLQGLALSENKLDGTLPTELGLLTDMVLISFSWNNLRGPLPSQVGQMTALSRLGLQENALSGRVPTEIGLPIDLKQLNAEENFFTGTLPTELGLFASPVQVDFDTNAITGTMPSQLGQLSNIKKLRLGNNKLTGTIPPQLVEAAPSIEVLDLRNNPGLSGVIPEGLCVIKDLCEVKQQCEEPTGFLYNCTSLLCGCDCSCDTSNPRRLEPFPRSWKQF